MDDLKSTKVDKTTITVQIKTEIIERLKAVCLLKDVTMRQVIEHALLKLIEREEALSKE